MFLAISVTMILYAVFVIFAWATIRVPLVSSEMYDRVTLVVLLVLAIELILTVYKIGV